MRLLHTHYWAYVLLDMMSYHFHSARYSPVHLTNGSIYVNMGNGIADPPNEAHASDLTRRLAKSLNAQAILLSAPGIAGSRETRDAFYGYIWQRRFKGQEKLARWIHTFPGQCSCKIKELSNIYQKLGLRQVELLH